MNDPLTFDLIYDLAQSSSCELCPILNDYNDIIQRSFTAEVNGSCVTAIFISRLLINSQVLVNRVMSDASEHKL